MATLGVALLIGLMLAIIAIPGFQRRRALRMIDSPNSTERTVAWNTLFSDVASDDAASRHQLLNDVNLRLLHVSDTALLHGIDELADRGFWGWDRQPPELMLRGIDVQIGTGEEAWLLDAAECLSEAPPSLDVTEFLPRIDAVLVQPDQSVRDLALDAALVWAGLARADLLATVTLPPGDAASEQRLYMALRWSDMVDRGILTPDSAPAEPPDDDRDADFILAILDDFPSVSSPAISAALLAEQLPADQSLAFAERWIRDFNDDRKRAGALLAALLGAHTELLAEAYRVEDVATVRTTQRLALAALGADPGPGDPIEFAHRVLRRSDGEIDPDTVFALLCAGHRSSLGWLIASPAEAGPALAAIRRWLVRRFVPQWNGALSHLPPDASDADRLLALSVLAKLTKRQMAFDASTRVYSFDWPAAAE